MKNYLLVGGLLCGAAVLGCKPRVEYVDRYVRVEVPVPGPETCAPTCELSADHLARGGYALKDSCTPGGQKKAEAKGYGEGYAQGLNDGYGLGAKDYGRR